MKQQRVESEYSNNSNSSNNNNNNNRRHITYEDESESESESESEFITSITSTSSKKQQKTTTIMGTTMGIPPTNNAANKICDGIDNNINNKVWDCIIVGGGCAGMSAAHRLVFEQQDVQQQDKDDDDEEEELQEKNTSSSSSSQSLSLLVLEASDHVGGRTRNYNLQTQRYDTYRDDDDNGDNGCDNGENHNSVVSDNIIELGGTWLSSEHTATIQLCKEHLGLDIFRASFINDDNDVDDVDESDDKSKSKSKTKSEEESESESESATQENNEENEDEEEYEEFPWWFWGIDYSENEMKQLKRIVLHRHIDDDIDTDDDVHKEEVVKEKAVTTFTTSKELFKSLDYRTVQQLDELKTNVINRDCDTILVNNVESSNNKRNKNVWDVTNVQKSWYDMDIQSTSDRILHPTTTTIPTTTTTNNNNNNAEDDTDTVATVVKVNKPLLTTINGRNILRNCIHNMDADEPDEVSYFYNLISWSGSNSGGPDTEYRVRGGTQAIPLKIAEKLKSHSYSLQKQQQSEKTKKSSLLWGDTRVMLNNPVRRIERVLPTPQQQQQHQDSTCSNDQKTKTKTIFKISTGDGTTTSVGQVFYCHTLLITGSPTAIHNSIDFVNKKGYDDNDDENDDDDDDEGIVLPTIQKELISPSKMKMGKCIKFMAIYKKNGPWWRKYNLQGDILSCGGLPKTMMVGVSSGNDGNNDDNAKTNSNNDDNGDEEEYVPLFPYCFDVSPKSQKFGVLCCFIEGIPYEYFHNTLSSDQQKNIMTEFLKLSFQDFISNDGNDGGDSQQPLWVPDDFISADWGPTSNEYVSGAYTGYFKPNVLSQSKYWNAYRQIEKSTNLFWAGADYHAGFGNGYIEGAIRSGQHAADLIRERLTTTTTS